MSQPIPDITPEALSKSLQTTAIGRALLILDSTESTNLFLEQIASTSPHGLVVVADHQSGGRGRNGHAWLSPPRRNLTFSILLKPEVSPGLVPQLSIVSALSMYATLLAIAPGLDVAVKWPNDVWIGGLKACGILCTMSCIGDKTEYAILGIGLNVNVTSEEIPAELQAHTSSLRIACGHLFDRSVILAAFLNAFEQDYHLWLQASSLTPFLQRWSQASLLDGHPITAEHGRNTLAGIARGITPDGQLRLETNGTTTLISAGEVARVRI